MEVSIAAWQTALESQRRRSVHSEPDRIVQGKLVAMSTRSATCAAVLLVLLSLGVAGCEQKAPPPEERTSTTESNGRARGASEESPADLAALKSYVSEQGAAARPSAPASGRPSTQMAPAEGSEMSSLPPGHPPIEGMSAPSAGAALPPGHPTIGGAGGRTNDSAGKPPSTLQYDPPAEWKSTPPRSAMRKAQYELPRAEGDTSEGEMIVFYFGPGEGGGTKENLDRWRGMFTSADGGPVGDDAVRSEEFEANGLKITLLEVKGRYAPGAMPGAAPVSPQDDYMMLAAVVETSGGPWFFKGTGPRATMEQHKSATRRMLESARE